MTTPEISPDESVGDEVLIADLQRQQRRAQKTADKYLQRYRDTRLDMWRQMAVQAAQQERQITANINAVAARIYG